MVGRQKRLDSSARSRKEIQKRGKKTKKMAALRRRLPMLHLCGETEERRQNKVPSPTPDLKRTTFTFMQISRRWWIR